MPADGQCLLGGIPERSKGPDCKSGGTAFAGSNPASPICGLVVVLSAGCCGGWKLKQLIRVAGVAQR